MSVGLADIHRAFQSAWTADGLDDAFKALWNDDDGTDDEFLVLHDQQAPPGQKFPFCVMDQASVTVSDRMSGMVGAEVREIRDVSLTLRIHARTIAGDSRTAKEIATYLAEEVIKRFGGHPETSPTSPMSLDNGEALAVQLVNEYGVETGADEYSWTLVYNVRTDVPVMV